MAKSRVNDVFDVDCGVFIVIIQVAGGLFVGVEKATLAGS